MTEETVRDVFFKNYSGGDLNEALMATLEQVTLATIRESAEGAGSLPEIVETIARAKSHGSLFRGRTDKANLVVPMHYLTYLDQIRKAMMDVVRYTRDNFEAMDPWLKERFTKEGLEKMSTEMASARERSINRPENIRTFHSEELELYEEFFNTALIGTIGSDNFLKYAKEYNKCASVLRQCQIECKILLSGKITTKES